MRVPVDINKLRKPLVELTCFVCGRQTAPVEVRHNSRIWYCSACDVYHETTASGFKLRSFREKEAHRIKNVPEIDDGPISS